MGDYVVVSAAAGSTFLSHSLYPPPLVPAHWDQGASAPKLATQIQFSPHYFFHPALYFLIPLFLYTGGISHAHQDWAGLLVLWGRKPSKRKLVT